MYYKKIVAYLSCSAGRTHFARTNKNQKDFEERGEMFVGDFTFTCCETFPLVSMSGPVKHAQTESEFPVGASKFFDILY